MRQLFKMLLKGKIERSSLKLGSLQVIELTTERWPSPVEGA